jgi:histone acetyltransferase (RNA polymerase elongator complex component)
MSNLKKYNVGIIELGVQSMDEHVLKVLKEAKVQKML